MRSVASIKSTVGTKAACHALDVPRASFYRWQNPPSKPSMAPLASPLALGATERQNVLDVLHAEEYMDQSPAAVYAALLDQGTYLCSVRTMYRILESEGESHERRKQRHHPRYEKPELLATSPNELWSWDITKLKGPAKWSYFYLYVILDVFSRYVVGWMISLKENGGLAKQLISETCAKQDIAQDQLTIHSDRGSSMKSKAVAFLLADLDVTKSHSRPYTSNDNCYSEAEFKTLKYPPDFPDRFGSIQDARDHCRVFFDWYNNEHYHSGIAMLTPQTVHLNRAQEIIDKRNAVLLEAAQANPLRFKHRQPTTLKLPSAVWINPPESSTTP